MFGPPPIPDSIKRLDEFELERRQKPMPNPLPPHFFESLFDQYPSVRKVHEAMTREMASDDYDPEDYRVYSWAYQQLRPTAIGLPLLSLIVGTTAFAIVKLIQYIRANLEKQILANMLVTADTVATGVLTGFIPVILLSWAWQKAHFNDVRTDGVRRSVTMFCLTALALPAVWAMSATTNVTLGIACALFVRFMLAFSIWGWVDLRREAFLGDALLARVYKAWRSCLTVGVLIFGSLLRSMAFLAPHEVPVKEVFGRHANSLRQALGKRFPVACSLCNDPRGLFLAGGLAIIALVSYVLYLAVFVTEFYQINCHRRCESPLTSLFVKKGIYQPNRHPDESKGSLSAPDPSMSFHPSPAMMLRPTKDWDSSTVQPLSGTNMPVFAYLKKEEEVMKTTGLTEWLKPRSEQVPAYDDESRMERDLDALLSWARPLKPEEEELSIDDYVQTVEDDEYMYDPTTGNWIFTDDLAESGKRKDGMDDRSDKMQPFELNGEEDEMVEIPPEWEPLVKRMLEKNAEHPFENQDDQQVDDDSDSPPVSIFA
ncbi:hypothetical protein BWQ96_00561 [Gracilariopsis chorda]|uniref:Transmembrane protein n=1 Tax=Gracilariopsis chorda TaxID=448386 RepID=A0A2V3J5U7_9FLOR|nr:hypothetical protein BWQ96_00561 [Gracilariopsis chorda]|eukprot:PXF49683.1 hypothetical protein BWQ96_00561 [Gracilariopsis chorda]